MQTPVVPGSFGALEDHIAPYLTGTIIAGLDDCQTVFERLRSGVLGVVGFGSWRGSEPFGFGNVDLIWFRLPPCRSHPLDPTNTNRFYRVGRQCTRQYERLSRREGIEQPLNWELLS
jgi:hypothetical protein